jgi:hypothetical protein
MANRKPYPHAIVSELKFITHSRVEEMAFAYRRFRGPDGRVYSLNEQK